MPGESGIQRRHRGVARATPASITLSCTGPNLTYSIVTYPTRGSVSDFSPSAGTLIYTAFPRATGTDAFTYQASNPMGTSEVSRATLVIQANPADFNSITFTPPPRPPAPRCKKPGKKGKKAGTAAKKKCGKRKP